MTPALIGANMRHWRERRGLTQQQLATRAGHVNSRAHLSRMEQGLCGDLAPYLAYADALEIPFAFLFRADAGDPFLAAILDAKLSPHDRNVLLEVLQDLHWKQRHAA